jgi:hypothetical protein
LGERRKERDRQAFLVGETPVKFPAGIEALTSKKR